MPQNRDIEYAADGTTFTGRLFLPDGEQTRPAILVAHEANGLGEHTLEQARRLADLGYVAFAMDYHGSARADTDAEMMRRLEYLGSHPAVMREIGQAALRALLAEPRTDPAKVAAIGNCYGAVMVLELARDGADVKAVIGFHPGSADHDPADSRNITGKVLVCIGAEDPWMPAKERLALEEEMRAAGVDWQMNIYGGAKHSFTNPAADHAGMPEIGYHQPSDTRSWQAMRALLEEVFTP
jgi:dienelactone hydrolase